MYDRAHYCDGYLIGLSTRIPSVDALPAGQSSGYVLDLLLLGFIAHATCLGNYSAVTPLLIE